MQSKGNIRDTSDKPKQSWVMLSVFGSIASVLTVYHSLLHPDPLSVFYVIAISILFTLVIIFIIFEISKNKNSLKYLSKTSIFLCIYILLIIWLGINKTIPEHREILKFQKNRTEMIYWYINNGRAGLRYLSLIYLRAKPEISRIEPNANHWGVKMMSVYLEGQIEKAHSLPEWAQAPTPQAWEVMKFLGGHQPVNDDIDKFLHDEFAEYTGNVPFDLQSYRNFVHDMKPTYDQESLYTYKLADDLYDLAEASFVYSSRDIAQKWYQNAYKYGRKDALTRYAERMKDYK